MSTTPLADRRISVFASGQRSGYEARHHTLVEVAACIRSDDLIDVTADYRARLAAAEQIPDPAERQLALRGVRDRKATMFSCAAFSGRCPDTGGRRPRMGQIPDPATNLITFDLDNIDDAAAARDSIAQHPSLAIAGISASGRGVWCCVLLDRAPCAYHQREHRVVWDHVRMQLGIDGFAVEPDRQASDALRVRFLVHDPDLYWNPDAEPMPIPSPAEIAAKVARPAAQRAVSVRLLSFTEPGARVPWDERPAWVEASDNPHDAMLDATRWDAQDDPQRAGEPERRDAYVDARGKCDRGEVDRAVNGAIDKVHSGEWSRTRDERDDQIEQLRSENARLRRGAGKGDTDTGDTYALNEDGFLAAIDHSGQGIGVDTLDGTLYCRLLDSDTWTRCWKTDTAYLMLMRRLTLVCKGPGGEPYRLPARDAWAITVSAAHKRPVSTKSPHALTLREFFANARLGYYTVGEVAAATGIVDRPTGTNNVGQRRSKLIHGLAAEARWTYRLVQPPGMRSRVRRFVNPRGVCLRPTTFTAPKTLA